MLCRPGRAPGPEQTSAPAPRLEAGCTFQRSKAPGSLQDHRWVGRCPEGRGGRALGASREAAPRPAPSHTAEWRGQRGAGQRHRKQVRIPPCPQPALGRGSAAFPRPPRGPLCVPVGSRRSSVHRLCHVQRTGCPGPWCPICCPAPPALAPRLPRPVGEVCGRLPPHRGGGKASQARRLLGICCCGSDPRAGVGGSAPRGGVGVQTLEAQHPPGRGRGVAWLFQESTAGKSRSLCQRRAH